MLAIENSKALYDAALSKQQKLNEKWEGFRTAFADNYVALVAHDSLSCIDRSMHCDCVDSEDVYNLTILSSHLYLPHWKFPVKVMVHTF
ncbi:hypothetical protein Fmac_012382 [Flemingia macrophylla]|uniref:Uncharacterized protein n=1 Tax=Flemingia macrophylla TaxID=520843 RepID=A0ABD1MQI5_9FABA